MKTRYADIPAYRTMDGSEIRELLHPDTHGNHNQSLAEAIVQPGARTRLHRHRISEEIYHVTHGRGLMILCEETFAIQAGDSVLVPPDTPHSVEATGAEPLRILCACSPAYRHEDTELLDGEG